MGMLWPRFGRARAMHLACLCHATAIAVPPPTLRGISRCCLLEQVSYDLPPHHLLQDLLRGKLGEAHSPLPLPPPLLLFVFAFIRRFLLHLRRRGGHPLEGRRSSRCRGTGRRERGGRGPLLLLRGLLLLLLLL